MNQSALSDIKVLDLSRVLAAPWCTQILADLGADVVKVENPDGGDDTRSWGPPFVSNGETDVQSDAAYFTCANRNKRSIAVNLASPEGQKIVQDLAAQSDVLVENYKTGGLRKFGLDFETLSKKHPDLIYCSITGFGQTGPYKSIPGYDFLIQAMGGLMSVTGDGSPTKVGVPAVDLFTGVYAASAILAAIHARQNGSGGQHIDMALLDVQIAMLANQASNFMVSGSTPPMHGNAHPNIVPYQDFPTSDGRLALAVGNDRQFSALANVLGRGEWAKDDRFKTNRARVENREQLIAEITVLLCGQNTNHWVTALNEVAVPCGPILTVQQAIDHDQTMSRSTKIELSRPDGTTIPGIANPMRLSSTPPRYELAPPVLGQHTFEVLHQRLAMDEIMIQTLKKGGIIV